MVAFIAIVRARCSAPAESFPTRLTALEIGLSCKLEKRCILVANLGADTVSLIVIAPERPYAMSKMN